MCGHERPPETGGAPTDCYRSVDTFLISTDPIQAFSLLSRSVRSKFTWKYYAPYFVELKKQGHTEAFVYYINQQSTLAGVDQWLEQHQNKVTDFLNWSKGYQWPKD